jgi:hypothetical protein
MCAPFQQNNLSISPPIDYKRKKSLFSRVVSRGKNHQDVVLKSENQEFDMPQAVADS